MERGKLFLVGLRAQHIKEALSKSLWSQGLDLKKKKSLSEDNSISSDICDRPHCFWLVRERVAPSPRVTSSGEGHNPKRISQVFLQPGFMDTWMPGPWWAREGRKEAGNSAQGQNTTGIWGGGRALESFWPGLTPGLVFCCHSWPVPLPSS